MRSSAGALVAITASLAACVPSTFDNLSGAKEDEKPIVVHGTDTKPDPSLEAPRPIAPMSGSWINSSSPKLKWELKDGSVGAIIELSQTRDFAGPNVKKFTAAGTEFPVPEKLPAGIWFWRLVGKSDTAVGEKQSPIWELLVRGPGLYGESSAPHSGIVDMNADGDPDLLYHRYIHWSYTENGQTRSGEDGDMSAMLASKETYDLTVDARIVFGAATLPAATVAAGIDLNGDGYGDFVVADIDATFGGGSYIWGTLGGANGHAPYGNDDDVGGLPFVTQTFTVPPALGVGDFNGDGYGDLSSAFNDVGMVLLGSRVGAGAAMPFVSTVGSGTAPPPGVPAIAGTDYDGDGIADLAYAPFDTSSPIRLAKGTRDAFAPAAGLTYGALKQPTRAIAITSGDFDGDGIDDVAFSTTVDGKPSVCVHSTSSVSLGLKSCWTSEGSALDTFGQSLGAADLDADGKDELLVTVGTSIMQVTHTGKGFTGDDTGFTAKALTGSFLPHLTVIHPGRPDKARWAAYDADGKTLVVHKGTDVIQRIDLSQSTHPEETFVRIGTILR